MKIPMTPPTLEMEFSNIIKTPSVLKTSFESIQATNDKGEYLHWDKIRHLSPPAGLTAEQWWFFIKLARTSLYKILPFKDKYKKNFILATPDLVLQQLHSIDLQSGNTVQNPTFTVNKNLRDSYLIQSLLEESITSSQLEGASTTRRVAKEMLREKRKPTNISERMIYNNYEAMQFVGEIKHEALSSELIIELQRILTKDTQEDPKSIGSLRKSNDVHVWDNTDQILHTPPDYNELPERLETICNFANAKDIDFNFFLHPVIKAILLHFMIGYDHPFYDGNGRTARALFYWSMANQGYWLMEFISISQILKKQPSKYAVAYLHTETDGNDTTYFVLHQLDIILKAIDLLHQFTMEKNNEIRVVEDLIYTNQSLKNRLNYRQIALLIHAMKHPKTQYLIERHQRSHGITYQTARTDMLKLVDLGLLLKQKIGKAFVFLAPSDLSERIENISARLPS